jgi:signal transduction histidine kinase
MTSILVVDDNPSNFDIIESIFAMEDIDVFYSSSGIHALELLKTEAVDVILLDVMMPEMDGFEVCRRVKENPKWSCIPIIMVTALDSKEDLAFCLQSGADDFVEKPVNALELRARVRSMLRIKKQYDDLQHLLQVRSDLTNMIIHDLRNPLTTIILASDILKRTPLTKKQQKKVEQIQSNGQRIISFIDDQLLIAQIEDGNLLLACEEVDVVAMIRHILEEFHLIAIANKQDISFVTDFPEQARLTTLDQSLFKRVIENLLANGIKFTNSGHKITIGVEYPPEIKLRISVCDEGCGISDEFKEVIFDRFKIGQVADNVQQTGLGLAFCKLAVEAHGGRIFVTDNQPQGSIFIIEI